MNIIRFFLSCLTAYFFGMVLYRSFYGFKYKRNLISKFHSFFLGLGFTSITFWFFTLATNGYNSNYPIVEFFSVVIIFLYLFIIEIRNRNKKHKIITNTAKNCNNCISTSTLEHSNKGVLDYIAIIVISLIALLIFFRCLRFPDGIWDAVTMWNFKAKFLASGNDLWSGMFSDYYNYIHRDYPLFLPCMLARIFIYVGGFISLVPLFFSHFFSISCFILSYLYLKELKNKYFALFALCVLAFSPYIIMESRNQYADIPLAVYFLISLYELIIWDMENKNTPWICICFSSLCFWVKNEGIPWFIFYLLFVFYYMYKNGNSIKHCIKCFIKTITISFPVIISILAVRYLANCETDLVLGLSDRLKQVFDINRYLTIIPFIWLFITSHFWIIVIPIFMIFKFIDKKYCTYKYLLFLVLLMYLWYFGVYIITPHELQWHLDTSFFRIVTHFLPSLAFLGCLLFDFKKDK